MSKNSMVKNLIAILCLATFFAGCSSPRITWNKPGSTRDDFNRDRYECVQQSRVSWSGGGSGDVGLFMIISSKSQAEDQSRELFKMCMEARGYTGKEVTKEEFNKQNEQEEQMKSRTEVQNEKLRLQKEAVEKAKQELSEERDKYQDKLSSISIKGNEVIVDNNNHVMWPKSADIVSDYIDWHSANKFIRTFDYAGYNDWRLPTEVELGYAYLSYNMFNNIKDEYYWSANTSDENFVKCFDMGKGYALSLLKRYEKVLLLPVRDNKEGNEGARLQIPTMK